MTSSIYRGYVENGRKYQTLKDGGYYFPSDERQLEVLQAGHLAYRILDSQEKNPLFHSPINDKAQNILDIGTGDGSWGLDVADNFPSSKYSVHDCVSGNADNGIVTVRGVDLFPPSLTLTAPNLYLEVDGKFFESNRMVW